MSPSLSQAAPNPLLCCRTIYTGHSSLKHKEVLTAKKLNQALFGVAVEIRLYLVVMSHSAEKATNHKKIWFLLPLTHELHFPHKDINIFLMALI